jgi:hypothetical protein
VLQAVGPLLAAAAFLPLVVEEQEPLPVVAPV